MTTEQLKKSADELVEQTLAEIAVEEPKVEETVVTETASEEVIVKSEDKAEEKKEDKKDDEKDEDKKPEMKKSEPNVIRKSLEELASVLTEDELTIIQTWREELESPEVETQVEETIVKSQTSNDDLIKSIRAEFDTQLGDLRKSLSDKDDLIKSLNAKVEELAAQPAHSGRAVDNIQVIEKSNPEQTLTKSKVLATMLDLQKSGKGVTSFDITTYETKGTFSNQHVRQLVMNACTNA